MYMAGSKAVIIAIAIVQIQAWNEDRTRKIK